MSCRPCLDVNEIRQNLLAQLVEPIDFMKLQDRLQAEGVTAILEVGPGQVLTQLMRQYLSLEEIALSYTDHPQRRPEESLRRVRAAFACAGHEIALSRPAQPDAPDAGKVGPVLEHDATQARRARRRQVADAEICSGPAENSAVAQFVLDYVVDLTGFAPNVINRQWDLEADLGIDSIKRAQLFGELKSVFAFEASDGQLAQLRTIDQIISCLEGNQPAPPQPPSLTEETIDPIIYERGRQLGMHKREEILNKLHQSALLPAPPPHDQPPTSERRSFLEGVAAGAQVYLANLLAYELNWGPLLSTQEAVTERLEMSLLACPRAGHRLTPEWKGDALILGQNEVAQSLQKRLQELSCQAHLIDPQLSREELLTQFDRHFANNPVTHLFLATSHDQGAAMTWSWRQERRRAGLESPFWLCQRWLHQVKRANLIDKASLVALTSMGGHFGLAGPPPTTEGGALSGLLKSVSIESWVAGHRSIVVQVVDRGQTEDGPHYIERVLLELANPSFDREIGLWEGQRVIPWARAQAAPAASRELTGNWLCTGGARGITAYVASQMATRFGLKLHLLGRAPRPEIDPQWLSLWPQQPQQLRLLVMEQARQQALNPVRHWETTEKALEIQDTLHQLSQRGIEAHYYSCDLADEDALERVLEQIRQHGPIEGVLHGAGISRDAKFEHKEAFRVEECFNAKIDGTLTLMRLTRLDPIKYWVGFGSISGRFGANGHADYSAANDMLAKLIGWYRGQRPEVCATTLHWHAWGDVGMAVRGETELGLKKIDMQFMPAREGLAHLLAELQSGAPAAEVLITNRRYCNQFFHHDRTQPSGQGSPILGGAREVWLDPQREVFLREHLLGGAPLLPLAVSLQILWEAGGPGTFHQVQAHHPLKYFDTKPRRLRVHRDGQCYTLSCEVVTRTGELVEQHRPLVSCCFATHSPSDISHLGDIAWTQSWTEMAYPRHSSGLVHGPALQTLREWQVMGQQLLGRMLAPALFELAGSWRNLDGWRVPSALLDGCFYAAAVLAWKLGETGSLVPQAIEWLWLEELPIPGEICQVRVQVERHTRQNWSFSFDLQGSRGQILLRARGLQMAALQLLSGVGS